MQKYDIIIVGSGIVGLSFANIMADYSDLKIAIVSADDPDSRKDHGRVCALNHASLKALKRLKLPDNNYSYYDKVYVWQDIGSLDFNAAEFGYSNLGAIVKNLSLEKQLWQRIRSYDNVTVFPNRLATELSSGRGHLVLLDDDSSLQTKLLVGADGASSWVRNSLGLSSKVESYNQSAIVANIETSEAHNSTAFQKFVATGTIALLPLQDANASSLVWSCCDDIADSLMSLTDQEFLQELSEQFDYKLGEMRALSKRISFPLRSMHSSSYIGQSAALIGDAAHVVHPLAGQGVNYGVQDAIFLANELISMGNFSKLQGALLRYETSRRGKNGFDLELLSQIKSIFTADSKAIKGVLGIGMNMVNSSKFIKKKLLAKALGF